MNEAAKKPMLPPGFKPARPPPHNKLTNQTTIGRNKSLTLTEKPTLPFKPKRRDVKSLELEYVIVDEVEKKDLFPILKNTKESIKVEDTHKNSHSESNNDKNRFNFPKPKLKKLEISSLKEQLNDIKYNFKPKSNLNKLKSISSPSLYHTDESTVTEREKDNVDGKLFGFYKKQKIKGCHSVDVSSSSQNEYASSRLKGLRSRAETAPDLMQKLEVENKFSDLHQNEDSQLFDHLLVVTLKKDEGMNLVPYISFRFPPKFDDGLKNTDEDQRINSIPQFCFPDISLATNNSFKASESFSFVLTDISGGRIFGYCRFIRMPSLKYPEVFCIISPYGLFSMYSQILDEVEKQRAFSSTAVYSYLKAVLAHSLPKPATSITVSFFTKHNPLMEKVILKRPGDSAIHEHVDLSELFSTLPVHMIIHLLSCLLVESKVILCANSLSLLSSCCHGLISLMYPFQWQHTYIPVLPNSLIDIVCLPTPYLLGLMRNAITALDDLPIEEVTIVNLEDKKYLRKDVKDILPKEVVDDISTTLSELLTIKIKESGKDEIRARNQVISEVFIYAYMQLIGHFEQYYEYNEERGEEVIARRSFCKASSSKEQKKFLKVFATTQAFQSYTINRKKERISYGLFERRFLEWKSNRQPNHMLKTNFKGLLTVFQKKFK